MPGLTRQALLAPDRRALDAAQPALNLSQGQPPRGDMGVPQALRPPEAGSISSIPFLALIACGRELLGWVAFCHGLVITLPSGGLSGEGGQHVAA